MQRPAAPTGQATGHVNVEMRDNVKTLLGLRVTCTYPRILGLCVS